MAPFPLRGRRGESFSQARQPGEWKGPGFRGRGLPGRSHDPERGKQRRKTVNGGHSLSCDAYNLADDPKYHNLMRSMHGAVKQEMERTGDRWDEQHDAKYT